MSKVLTVHLLINADDDDATYAAVRDLIERAQLEPDSPLMEWGCTMNRPFPTYEVTDETASGDFLEAVDGPWETWSGSLA